MLSLKIKLPHNRHTYEKSATYFTAWQYYRNRQTCTKKSQQLTGTLKYLENGQAYMEQITMQITKSKQKRNSFDAQ